MSDVVELLLIGAILWLAMAQRKLRARLERQQKTLDSLGEQLAARMRAPARQEAPAAPAESLSFAEALPALEADMPALDGTGIPEPGPEVPPIVQDSAPIAPAEVRAAEPAERPVVLTPDLGARIARFLQANWVYVVSALSLGFAGVFLVQYGIERGLLTPPLRVAGAVTLGIALVLAGERLRRRGATPDAPLLPATFSGAGIVVIFAAIVAARQYYGLIGPAATFVGLAGTGAAAIVLGWFHGPFLIALGLIGGAAVPFLTGGGGAAPAWLMGYDALLAAVGLSVDTIRRWGWVSALALGLAYGAGWLAMLGGAPSEAMVLLLLALPVLAIAIPDRSLIPRHDGPSITETRGRGLPPFPVRLVAGTMVASAVLLVAQALDGSGAEMMALVGLAVLGLALLLWAQAAPGLADLALPPALGLLVLLVVLPISGSPMFDSFRAADLALRAPESDPPATMALLMGLVAALVLAAGLRSLTGGALARWQAQVGLALGGAAVGALHLFWDPASVLGAFGWAVQIMVQAALAAGLALAFARRDGADDRHRTATAALVALSLIALSLGVMTSGTALTLALAVLIVVAAELDRRFDLPEMTLFLQAGAAVLTWRMLVDPGVLGGLQQSLPDFAGAFLGPVLAGAASLWRLSPRVRPVARAVLDSATVLWAVLFLDALVLRWLDARPDAVPEYLGATLMAMPWLAGGLTQVWRAAQVAPLRRVRRVVAGFSLVLGVFLMLLSMGLSPLLSYARIDGPLLLDSLALAHLVPGLVILAAALRLPGLAAWLRKVGLGMGAVLGALYLVQEIRRFWWGETIYLDQGIRQGELYTYTVVLMILGAGLLAGALAQHSAVLRRVAMGVIALTIAKVFLWDAAGLTGLTRVVSFLGLGLSLAGLAWLNGVVDRATRAAALPGPPQDPAAG